MTMQNKLLLDSLAACIAACEHCVAASLHETEVAQMTDCIEKSRDCADFCRLMHLLVARGSALTLELLEKCVTVCENCAAVCDVHAHGQCKECAAACRQCAEVCRKFAAAA